MRTNSVDETVTAKPSGRAVLFQRTKERPPRAPVIALQSCHRPVIIKEPAIFHDFRAHVNFSNPCTFPLLRAHWDNEGLSVCVCVGVWRFGEGRMLCPSTHARLFVNTHEERWSGFCCDRCAAHLDGNGFPSPFFGFRHRNLLERAN